MDTCTPLYLLLEEKIPNGQLAHRPPIVGLALVQVHRAERQGGVLWLNGLHALVMLLELRVLGIVNCLRSSKHLADSEPLQRLAEGVPELTEAEVPVV
mmetsp:Transcript_3926/g.8542  ORF Transcript_3926/g.8542 Transcript_3926/m.8542 type:complete len:98 (+) Transcript_3926:163-456(+)